MLQSLHIVHKFTLHSSDFTRQEIICQADMEVLAVERSAMKIPNGNDDHHNGYNDKIQFFYTSVVGCCDFTLAACFLRVRRADMSPNMIPLRQVMRLMTVIGGLM